MEVEEPLIIPNGPGFLCKYCDRKPFDRIKDARHHQKVCQSGNVRKAENMAKGFEWLPGNRFKCLRCPNIIFESKAKLTYHLSHFAEHSDTLREHSMSDVSEQPWPSDITNQCDTLSQQHSLTGGEGQNFLQIHDEILQKKHDSSGKYECNPSENEIFQLNEKIHQLLTEAKQQIAVNSKLVKQSEEAVRENELLREQNQTLNRRIEELECNNAAMVAARDDFAQKCSVFLPLTTHVDWVNCESGMQLKSPIDCDSTKEVPAQDTSYESNARHSADVRITLTNSAAQMIRINQSRSQQKPNTFIDLLMQKKKRIQHSTLPRYTPSG